MQWQGKWIWSAAAEGEEKPLNYYAYFRKTVELPAKPAEASARICADSRYKLFVNGKFVCRGPVRSDPRWQYYDVVDLTPYLRRGKNVIAALVHHYGTGTFTYILGRGGVLFDCAISCLDPSSGKLRELSLISDDSWRLLPAQAWFRDIPRMDVQLEFNEVYDANLAPDGWTEIAFDDSSWQQAKVIGKPGMPPWPNLVPREIPFMYEHEIYPVKVLEVGIADPVGVELPEDNKAPIAAIMGREKKEPLADLRGIVSDPDGVCRRPNVEDIFEVQPLDPRGKPESVAARGWRIQSAGRSGFTVYPLPEQERYAKKNPYIVLDFGREIAGHPRIRLKAKGKGVVDLGYSELLTDGKVDPYRAGVNYADRYRMKPGAQEWETFDKRAFRYVQLDFREITEPLTIESVSVNFSTYPVRWRGKFESNDERLNEIWRIGAYTVQLNMEDAYTDCPWRERTQWWGDARIEALSNYHAFGDSALIRQGIKQIGQSQREDGATMCFWPGTFDNPIPSFSLYWIMSIWDYYTFTGDKSLIPEVYPKVKNLIKWFEGFRDKRGLLTDVSGWMFIEWTNTELEGTVAALNCIYYRALVNASGLARLAKDREAARVYADRAQELRNAINTHLYDAGRGAYPEYWSDKQNAFSPKISQMVNGLVAAYGIAPSSRREAVLRYVLDPKNQVVPAGSFFAYYLLLAMFENGLIQESLDYIRTSWGMMLDWGATVFWEQWHTHNSLCHGWASAPTIHLPSYVLGVQPSEPGFRQFTVAPNLGDLTWAKGVVPCPSGDIEVECRRADGGFDLTVLVPDGTSANVALPIPKECDRYEIAVNGRKKPPAGVIGGRLSAGRVLYTITQPGEYRFELLNP